MCMSVKTPKPPEAPATPPPPTAVAETVKSPVDTMEPKKKRRGGVRDLVINRATMGGVGTSTGVNTSNY